MNFYSPLSRNGRPIQLPFQFFAYKLNSVWPLEANASRLHHYIKYTTLGLSLFSYFGTILAEFSFIKENPSDIPAVAECLTTTLMGLQYIIRITILGMRQSKMRTLLQRFYREIFFTSLDDATLNRELKSITRFVDFFTKIYYIPMILIFIAFTWEVVNKDLYAIDKPYIYKMSFPWYNAQQPFAYIITSFYTGWLNMSCVTLMAADDYLLSILLCHISYRFKALHSELQCLLKDTERTNEQTTVTTETDNQDQESLKHNRPFNLHNTFRRRLYRVFHRQQRLNSVIEEAKSHFTYQIFYFISFGVLCLCVVMFQFQRTTIGIGWVKYVVWIISQISQFILIGHFGQMLMDEAAEMQNSFYMCNWEALMPLATPTENKNLMADIKFAIANGQRAIVFDGMKMFPLSRSTVGTALRSAMSYFMFLNTMNDSNKDK